MGLPRAVVEDGHVDLTLASQLMVVALDQMLVFNLCEGSKEPLSR